MFVNRIIMAVLMAAFGLTALTPVAVAQSEPPKATQSAKPIESLWFMSVRRFPGMPESDAALLRTLKEWQSAKVFDAFVLYDFPPTFANGQDFTTRANALIKEVGGRFIIATLPVGKEGWESSANERLANKQMSRRWASSTGSLGASSIARCQREDRLPPSKAQPRLLPCSTR